MPRSDSANSIFLRNVTEEDIPVLFEQQLDPDANHMAAFTAPNPADREAFTEHWARIRGDRTIIAKTVLCEGRVAGHVGSFVQFGEREVSYWLGKDIGARALLHSRCRNSLVLSKNGLCLPVRLKITQPRSGCWRNVGL